MFGACAWSVAGWVLGGNRERSPGHPDRPPSPPELLELRAQASETCSGCNAPATAAPSASTRTGRSTTMCADRACRPCSHRGLEPVPGQSDTATGLGPACPRPPAPARRAPLGLPPWLPWPTRLLTQRPLTHQGLMAIERPALPVSAGRARSPGSRLWESPLLLLPKKTEPTRLHPHDFPSYLTITPRPLPNSQKPLLNFRRRMDARPEVTSSSTTASLSLSRSLSCFSLMTFTYFLFNEKIELFGGLFSLKNFGGTLWQESHSGNGQRKLGFSPLPDSKGKRKTVLS